MAQKFFGQIWENSGKILRKTQKFACPYTYGSCTIVARLQQFVNIHYYYPETNPPRIKFCAASNLVLHQKCGQAGNVRSLIAQFGRVLGGTDAEERAWPWHALITQKWNVVQVNVAIPYFLLKHLCGVQTVAILSNINYTLDCTLH